jgi:hypothetical protein
MILNQPVKYSLYNIYLVIKVYKNNFCIQKKKLIVSFVCRRETKSKLIFIRKYYKLYSNESRETAQYTNIPNTLLFISKITNIV